MLRIIWSDLLNHKFLNIVFPQILHDTILNYFWVTQKMVFVDMVQYLILVSLIFKGMFTLCTHRKVAEIYYKISLLF